MAWQGVATSLSLLMHAPGARIWRAAAFGATTCGTAFFILTSHLFFLSPVLVSLLRTLGPLTHATSLLLYPSSHSTCGGVDGSVLAGVSSAFISLSGGSSVRSQGLPGGKAEM